MLHLGPRAHTAKLFYEEDILPVREMIEYNAIKFMHSYKYDYCPKTFKDSWKYNKSNNSHNTRKKNDFFKERFSLSYFRNHPLFEFPTLWNNLPEHIKIMNKKGEFLRNVKDHLMNRVLQNANIIIEE